MNYDKIIYYYNYLLVTLYTYTKEDIPLQSFKLTIND